MQWKPNVTVAAVINRDGQFLVVEEDVGDGVVINQPAGHLEQGETILDAVCREVLEETRWEFLPRALVGIYLYPSSGAGVTYLRFCFSGDCGTHHAGRPLDTGIRAARWLSRDALGSASYRMRSPLVLRCIDDFLAGQSCPLSLLHHLEAGP